MYYIKRHKTRKRALPLDKQYQFDIMEVRRLKERNTIIYLVSSIPPIKIDGGLERSRQA